MRNVMNNRLLTFCFLVPLVALAQSSSGEGGTSEIRERKRSCFAEDLLTLKGYDAGGTFTLAHFRHTTGRAGLRSFLWEHWKGKHRGYATAEAGTVDAGVVKLLYIVQPNKNGQWGVDVKLERQVQPRCSRFHATS